MKTVVIWDCLEAELKFFVADGDLSRFDGVYVNGSPPWGASAARVKSYKDLTDELCAIVYDDEGSYIVDMQPRFPIDSVQDGAMVITAGFLP